MLKICPMGVQMTKAARCAPSVNITRTTDFFFFTAELLYEENSVLQEQCQAKTLENSEVVHFIS